VIEQPKTVDYFDGFNEHLFAEVPKTARRIVEIGCARGRLGLELKRAEPGRTVIGVEYDPAAAEVASSRLDEVMVCDLQVERPDIPAGSADCVIFGDVLEHLIDPEQVLRWARDLLADGGVLLTCVPNFTHFSVIKALLRSDPMYQPNGLLDATHIRFFSHATFIKMLLDVGLLPDLVHTIRSGGTEHVLPAAGPLLAYVGVSPETALRRLDAYQYIFAATKLPDLDEHAEVSPLSFVVCVNDEDQLQANLLRSPCLWPGSPHELLTYRGMSSAAAGLDRGLQDAAHDVVVLVQQDMYLPRGWDRRFDEQLRSAEQQFGPIGVAGIFGLRYRETGTDPDSGGVLPIGRAVDRDALLDWPTDCPAAVDGLDEILLAVRHSSGLRADPDLGFHLYGADLCLSAHAKGLPAVVLDAVAYHNSQFTALDPSFHAARVRLLEKWPDVRPLATNMGRLDTMADLDAPDHHRAAPVGGDPAADAAGHQVEIDRLRAELRSTEERLHDVLHSTRWRASGVLARLARRP
jgi:SAM-dependent methyltransferase